MATTDKRNVVENLNTGGTDVGLAVHLSGAEAVAIYGGTSPAGWYIFGTFDGGRIAYAVDSEKDRDESGQFTGAVIEKSDTFSLENTIKETDDATQDLIDQVLSKGPHKYRYPLPMKKKGTGGEKLHQVYGIQNGIADKGWEIGTAADGKRMRAFRLEASEMDGVPAYVRKTVDLTDQENWPDELAPFTDV